MGIILEMYANNESIVVLPLILQYLQKLQIQKKGEKKEIIEINKKAYGHAKLLVKYKGFN